MTRPCACAVSLARAGVAPRMQAMRCTGATARIVASGGDRPRSLGSAPRRARRRALACARDCRIRRPVRCAAREERAWALQAAGGGEP